MPIYMNYNSLAIKGDVTEASHKDWIELNSLQWGVGRGISSPTGGAADRESSAPSVAEIVVTKANDISSAKVLNEALQGEGQTVIIDFCRTDKGKLQVYLTYTLTNTMISSYSLSSGGDRPSESLSLNFTKVEYKQIPAAASGQGLQSRNGRLRHGHREGQLTSPRHPVRSRPAPRRAGPDQASMLSQASRGASSLMPSRARGSSQSDDIEADRLRSLELTALLLNCPSFQTLGSPNGPLAAPKRVGQPRLPIAAAPGCPGCASTGEARCTMSAAAATSYDDLPYESRFNPVSHPDRIATMAILHGLKPPPVECCRVLELGSADGGNLLAMAQTLPSATFLGLDLAPSDRRGARPNARGCSGSVTCSLRAMNLHGRRRLARTI